MKLPEISSDTLKNKYASLILISCRLIIKCLTHNPPCQINKTYCGMLIIIMDIANSYSLSTAAVVTLRCFCGTIQQYANDTNLLQID